MAEEEIGGTFQSLLPPKLEDAGLEDCALPPESIMEAFSRAAISIKSRFTEGEEDDEENEGGCVQDPGPSNGEIADVVFGGGSESLPVCGGGGVGSGVDGGKGSGDEVVVVGVGEEEVEGDRVVVVGGEQEEGDVGEKRSCVEGIGEGILDGKKKLGHSEEEDEDEGEGESDGRNVKPILVEDLI